MFLKTPSITMEQLKKEFNLDEFSYNLVYKYLTLPPSQREKVRDFFYSVISPEENIDYIAKASIANNNFYNDVPDNPEELERLYGVHSNDESKMDSSVG